MLDIKQIEKDYNCSVLCTINKGITTCLILPELNSYLTAIHPHLQVITIDNKNVQLMSIQCWLKLLRNSDNNAIEILECIFNETDVTSYNSYFKKFVIGCIDMFREHSVFLKTGGVKTNVIFQNDLRFITEFVMDLYKYLSWRTDEN